METTVFHCDFCGAKSEEENVAWNRPRCSIELILRGKRFAVTGAHTLYGVPFAGEEAAGDIEDSRWALSLCDHCMKRISALVGLNLESAEEISRRSEEHARQVARRMASESNASTMAQGKLVTQFPTPSQPTIFSEQPGGLVAQYPTDPGTTAPEMQANQDSSSMSKPGKKSSDKKKDKSRG